jgi:hypothetical protein
LTAGNALVGIYGENLASFVQSQHLLGAKGHANTTTFAKFLIHFQSHVHTSQNPAKQSAKTALLQDNAPI